MSEKYSGFNSAFISQSIRSSEANRQSIAKGFTVNPISVEGLQGYNLDTLVKNLFPVKTPISNMLPRRKTVGGNAAHWKAFTAINTLGISGSVEEGKRGGIVDHTLIDKAVPFSALGYEDVASFEAILAAQNLDAKSQLLVNLSEKLYASAKIEEEKKILYGNRTAIGKVADVSLVAGTSGSIPAGDVSVIAVGLTGYGLRKSSVANGVNKSALRQNAGNTQSLIVGGHGLKSDAVEVTVAANGSIDFVVTDLRAAAGYAVFAGAAGAERLVYVGAENFGTIKALSTTSQLASDLPNTDQSADTLEWDGFLSTAANEDGTIVSLDGASFTMDGQVAPELESVISAIRDKTEVDVKYLVMNNKTASAIFKSARGKDANVATVIVEGKPTVVGSFMSAYVSNVTASEIMILRDPHMQDGHVLFWSDDLSELGSTGIDEVAEMIVWDEWTMIEWPIQNRQREYGVYAVETFAHKYPATIGYIKNAKVK